MSGEVNWDSISAKVASAAAKKIKKAIREDVEMMEYMLPVYMEAAILDNHTMTNGEAERALEVPLRSVGSTITSYYDKSNIGVEFKIYFDFDGDKTLVSLSPNKEVHDLIALFNNGYPSNNVNPDRPIRGTWHGKDLVIYPRSKRGAHFIGRAIEQFKEYVNKAYPGSDIDVQVNPNYYPGT